MAVRGEIKSFFAAALCREAEAAFGESFPEDTGVLCLVVYFVGVQNGVAGVYERWIAGLQVQSVNHELHHHDISGSLLWRFPSVARQVGTLGFLWDAMFQYVSVVGRELAREASVFKPIGIKAVGINHIPVNLEQNRRPDFSLGVDAPIALLGNVAVRAGIHFRVARVRIPSDALPAIRVLGNMERIVARILLAHAQNCRKEIAPGY
jgi:hypothetical protein